MSVYPCNVCGEDAVACLRPDLDIKGLCFCEPHRDEVYTVYMMLLQDGGEEMAKPIIAKWRHE